MKSINKKYWEILKYIFVYCLLFFFIANGIRIPKAEAAKGKTEDCKNVKAILGGHGYARGDFSGTGPEPKSPTKTYTNYTNIRVIENGNKVPLEDGSIIYFSYRIQNLPKDKDSIDGFKIVLTFPEIKNPVGQKFTSYTVTFSINKQKKEVEYNNEHYWSFSNSDSYEMVEGDFTYYLYYKTCLLLEYTFYTYKK